MRRFKNKAIKLVGVALFTFTVCSGSVFAGTIPKVYLNNNKVFMQSSPFVKDGTTYIPIRATEQFGFYVGWNNATSTVTLTDGKNTVIQTVGNKVARVNGKGIDLGAPAMKKDGAIYVPLRFVNQALGGTLAVDKKNNVINATYKINARTGYGFDFLGRYIKLNTTPLGDTKNFQNYTPVGISQDFFKIPLEYNSTTWKITPKEGIPSKTTGEIEWGTDLHFIRPKNIGTYWRTKDEYMKDYINVAERHFDLVLNVDYRTINDSWAKAVAATEYYKVDENDVYGYMRVLNEAREYVRYVQDNKIIIQGDFYIEPSLAYHCGGLQLRAWIKYKTNKNTDIYDSVPRELVEGAIWHEGYIDIGLGSALAEATGKDVVIGLNTPTFPMNP